MNWASNPRADGYSSNGSDERDFARQYYDCLGYSYEGEWLRENEVQQKLPCSQTSTSGCLCRKKGCYEDSSDRFFRGRRCAGGVVGDKA